MNVLMVTAAVGAFLIGHGEEGATVLFLFAIAEYLEEYAAERAERSIGSLIQLVPECATVIRDRKEAQVLVDDVQIGEMVAVRPGDKIPLDGLVAQGTSAVNQAAITGESVPVTKQKGDEVFAGTMAVEGYLEITVTKRSHESTLARIMEYVEKAQERRSVTEAFIGRFARYYTPIVLLLAGLIVVVPPLAFGLPWEESIYRGLVLLVISCPCALAISTPVSMVSGITSAARNGILVKGRDYLEEAGYTSVIVFDKTGTLTRGNLEVTDAVAFPGHTENEVLAIAAALESRSGHPIATAITRLVAREGIVPREVQSFVSVTGKGLTGEVEGKKIAAGTRLLFPEGAAPAQEDTAESLENAGKTLVFVGMDGRNVGIIALRDTIKEDASQAIRDIRALGIRTIMLTGDNDRVARAVASELGIDEYYAALLPDEKQKKVAELVERYSHVMMVGDGVNDAPALAQASVGVAMGAAGSDIAIETADIVIMEDRIAKCTDLINLSRRSMAIVKQNVAVSILVKTTFAGLALFGFITLWMAVGAGDMGLSLAVIANALRLQVR
jgi:Cd2+/Zn2+-exporting ATPase